MVGYYSGVGIPIDSFETDQLTHLIFCFGNLENNRIKIHTAVDSSTIQQMVKRKKTNPSLKVMLSLGGWGGCKTCSDVFNTEEGRKEFAQSVYELSTYFKTDGLDLDWEYPAIKGVPDHTFRQEDRANFTALVKELRQVNGKNFELSFAAGGFTQYINESIDWKSVLKYVNFINIMTYDLVHGYSTTSGHHTPLYSTPMQTESSDNAVKMLLQKGVPANKLVIGAAFYGRFFEITNGYPVDLYQPCKFTHGFSFKHQQDSLSLQNGFEQKWDPIAQAPYAIHPKRRLLASYDNEQSIALKTKYALDHKLGGIMFWQLYDDKLHKGLLNIIHSTIK
ncbi:MAG: glycoside hydrolase family 18 protein [Bacteroidetes bacterium]|nr:glycoside hydrolase family 18 protein [Bacteroidota bacterium]MBK8145187.1 glycoside hydrolase family 18 protein [Bacteroidota bacterium]